MTNPATSTPIVIVEDRGALAMAIPAYLRQAQAELQPYHIVGAAQVVASGRGLLKWLQDQPPATVRLLLLDFSIFGGTSVKVLRELRQAGADRITHPALHPEALVIGWSAEPEAALAFQQAGADGFISKHRPVPQIANDILAIAQRHQAGEAWVELHPGIG